LHEPKTIRAHLGTLISIQSHRYRCGGLTAAAKKGGPGIEITFGEYKKLLKCIPKKDDSRGEFNKNKSKYRSCVE